MGKKKPIKKITGRKPKRPNGKAVLYADVLTANKDFVARRAAALERKGQGQVNQSAVVDRILTWVRQNPKAVKTIAV